MQSGQLFAVEQAPTAIIRHEIAADLILHVVLHAIQKEVLALAARLIHPCKLKEPPASPLH